MQLLRFNARVSDEEEYTLLIDVSYNRSRPTTNASSINLPLLQTTNPSDKNDGYIALEVARPNIDVSTATIQDSSTLPSLLPSSLTLTVGLQTLFQNSSLPSYLTRAPKCPMTKKTIDAHIGAASEQLLGC